MTSTIRDYVEAVFARGDVASERELAPFVVEKQKAEAPYEVSGYAVSGFGTGFSVGQSSVRSAADIALQATANSVKDKLARYLLNPNHPVGSAKARWFEDALGFTQENAEGLAEQIVFDSETATEAATTEFVPKYHQVVSVRGANGRTIDVTFVWIKTNADGVARLVTAIPTKAR